MARFGTLKPTFTFESRQCAPQSDRISMTQTVLIVDDDPVQRRLLEACISRDGLQTLTAPGGGPALDLLFSPKGEQVALVLLDLMMPDVDGIQVLTKLRAANQDLPVIVLTAKGGIDS